MTLNEMSAWITDVISAPGDVGEYDLKMADEIIGILVGDDGFSIVMKDGSSFRFEGRKVPAPEK